MQNLGYYNGEIKPLSELKIPAMDRAVYFGDGVYEVCYCVNQTPFALKEHIDRFYYSLSLLKIDFKMKKEELKDLLKKILKQQNSKFQMLYWQISRGSGLRDHIFPVNTKPNLLIMVSEKKIVDMHKNRYNLILQEDTRFLHCNIKTINLLPAVLASEKAKQNNCNEAILHRKEMVTECAHSNIAILKNGVFQTAPNSNLILPGVTRAHTIEICEKLKIPTIKKHFTITEMFQADEIIVLASGCLLMGVDSVNGKKVGAKSPLLLKKLQTEYEKKFIDECGANYK